MKFIRFEVENEIKLGFLSEKGNTIHEINSVLKDLNIPEIIKMKDFIEYYCLNKEDIDKIFNKVINKDGQFSLENIKEAPMLLLAPLALYGTLKSLSYVLDKKADYLNRENVQNPVAPPEPETDPDEDLDDFVPQDEDDLEDLVSQEEDGLDDLVPPAEYGGDNQVAPPVEPAQEEQGQAAQQEGTPGVNYPNQAGEEGQE